jgi:hypothetical protein
MKTSELTGAALDWAVAKCERVNYHGPAWTKFSTDWAQGGPIIEREWVDLHCVNDSLWEAECPAVGGLAMQNGPTPLIAAMRCYVASKLGDDVTLPPELEQSA